ncbi:MAG: rod shape-determining protein MreC, partial [Rikenellaceae bacterium]
MNKFFIFFKRIHIFILFALIEIIAINHFSNSSIYANAKVMNASNFFVRGVYDMLSTTQEYINLREENIQLSSHIAELEAQIGAFKARDVLVSDTLAPEIDSSQMTNILLYTNARVVRNSVSKQNNYITLSKGSAQGIEKDMSVIYNGCIVGYVLDCSKNYSIAISILNRDFKTSGKCTNDEYFGSIRWDGIYSDKITLEDIPKYASIAIGDTIVTTDFSSRFPSNIKIGTVKDFELSGGINYRATIELFTDMSKIYNVILIKNKGIE